MAQKKDKKTGKFRKQDFKSKVVGFRTRGKSPIIFARFYDANGVSKEWTTGTSSLKDAKEIAKGYSKTTAKPGEQGSKTNPVIRGNRRKEAVEYLKKNKKSIKGTTAEILDRANSLKSYKGTAGSPYKKLQGYLSTTKKQRKSIDVRNKVGALHKQLLNNPSLATDPKFIKKVDAFRIVRSKNPSEARAERGAKRRESIIRQTPKWAIENPGFRTELKQFGYSGRSYQTPQIQKMFPGKFHSDHIARIASGGLNAPHNLQLLTVEQHKQKTALENKKQFEKARNLFKFNPYRLRPEVRGLLAEEQKPIKNSGGSRSVGGGGGMGIMNFKSGQLNFGPLRRFRKLY